MDPDYKLCDICQARCLPGQRLSFAVDRKADASGCMDDVVEVLDLCPAHMHEAVVDILHQNDLRMAHKVGRCLLAWADWKAGIKPGDGT